MNVFSVVNWNGIDDIEHKKAVILLRINKKINSLEIPKILQRPLWLYLNELLILVIIEILLFVWCYESSFDVTVYDFWICCYLIKDCWLGDVKCYLFYYYHHQCISWGRRMGEIQVLIYNWYIKSNYNVLIIYYYTMNILFYYHQLFVILLLFLLIYHIVHYYYYYLFSIVKYLII